MKKIINNRYLTTILYLTVTVLVLYGLSILFPNLLQAKNFLRLDAILYFEIAQEGYEGFKMAFFPLFPKVWGWCNLSVVGIITLNGIVYLATLLWLAKSFKISGITLLFWLATPSAIFYFLPYSESFFFFGSVALLIGIKKNNVLMICISLLICSLARPAYTVFIPAIFFLEIIRNQGIKETFYRILLFIVPILTGTFLVAVIQYLDTGEWFKFFEAQSLWGNKLQWPQFPLRSWGEEIIARLDGLALIVGGISAYLVVKEFYRKINKKDRKLSDVVLFSCLYVAGISMAVLLFRGGSLFSLNRFVFATPFFLVLVRHYLKEDMVLKLKHYVYFFLAIFIFWLLFASYVHITFLLKFLLLTIFCLIVLLMKDNNEQVKKLSFSFVLLTMFIFQIYLLIRYLDGKWVA